MTQNEIFPELPFSLGNYIIQNKIGSGGYGTVFAAYHSTYDQLFAAKVIQKVSSSSPIKYEFEMMMKLVHPNIIRLYDMIEYQDYLVIILEYCDCGSVSRLLKKIKHDEKAENKGLTIPLFNIFAEQIISAILYIHEKNIAHCDIKPENLLINNGRIKVTDFGLSLIIDQKLKAPKGMSLPYAPPEIINSNSYDPIKGDIWSLGITFYKMLTGSLPWRSKNNNDLKNEIAHASVSVDFIDNPVLRKMIYKMLTPYYNMRPTMKEVQVMFDKYLESQPLDAMYHLSPLKLENIKQSKGCQANRKTAFRSFRATKKFTTFKVGILYPLVMKPQLIH